MSVQQDKFKIIADKIREKTGTTEAIKPNNFAEKIDDVYQAGQNSQQGIINSLNNELEQINDRFIVHANEVIYTQQEMMKLGVEVEYDDNNDIVLISKAVPDVYDKGYADGQSQGGGYDEFWDSYQNNGKRTDYRYAFAGSGWNKDTYNPKYPLVVAGGGMAAYMFSNSLIKKIGDIDMSKVTGQIANFIRQNTELTEVGEIVINNAVTQLTTFLYSNNKLVTVKKLKFGTVSTFTNAFYTLYDLVNITIDGVMAGDVSFGDSKLLSKESLISIINALSSVTTAKTLTLSKEAVNNAFGIDIDNETTYPEGSEYYILRNSKSNWTFNYV